MLKNIFVTIGLCCFITGAFVNTENVFGMEGKERNSYVNIVNDLKKTLQSEIKSEIEDIQERVNERLQDSGINQEIKIEEKEIDIQLQNILPILFDWNDWTEILYLGIWIGQESEEIIELKNKMKRYLKDEIVATLEINIRSKLQTTEATASL